MIFVTVGTHEQQFDRLVKCIDDLCANGFLSEEVIVQTGYSQYEPKHCKWSKFLPYQEMLRHVKEARIVITHGGPSSFIMPLQEGKIPIVVPRKAEYDEHVNDHQLDFARKVSERIGSIIVVENTDDLKEQLFNYDQTAEGMRQAFSSNNVLFCRKFEELVEATVRK